MHTYKIPGKFILMVDTYKYLSYLVAFLTVNLTFSILKYSDILFKVVVPKQIQVAEAQSVLKIAQQRLAEKQRGLQLVRIFFTC